MAFNASVGTADYVKPNSATTLAIGSNFTFAYWFKTTNNSQLISGIGRRNGSAGQAIWTLHNYSYVTNPAIATADYICWQIQYSGTNRWMGEFTDATMSDGNWHHFCATRAGATVKIYYDGVDQNVTAIASGGYNNLTSISMTLDAVYTLCARSVDATYTSFDGECAEYGHWNTALSAAQVMQLYHCRPSFVANDNLLHSWSLLRNTPDLVTGNVSTVGGSAAAVSEHPPIVYFQQPFVGNTAAASEVAQFMDGAMTEDEWWTRRRKQYWHRRQWGG